LSSHNGGNDHDDEEGPRLRSSLEAPR
jgi:hypothetical protein